MAIIDKEFIIMENASSPTSGVEFIVGKVDSILIEISGNSTSRNITFNKKLFGNGSLVPINAFNETNMAFATSTTGNNEIWEIETSGLYSIVVNLTAVSGGSVTIKGRAIT